MTSDELYAVVLQALEKVDAGLYRSDLATNNHLRAAAVAEHLAGHLAEPKPPTDPWQAQAAGANQTHDIFVAYLAAGFSEAQAMTLTTTLLASATIATVSTAAGQGISIAGNSPT